MTAALSYGNSPIIAIPFGDISMFIEKSHVIRADLIVLHSQRMDGQLPLDIAALRAADLKQPIILVTGDDPYDQLTNVRNSLRLGASGHLSTQSTGIELAISSFAFAHQGGTFAPINLLLADGMNTRRIYASADRLARDDDSSLGRKTPLRRTAEPSATEDKA